MWRDARLVAAKDLRIEVRSRVALNQIAPFALLVLLLFAFALDSDRTALRDATPGLFWVAVLLSTLLAVQRAFSLEAADGVRDAGKAAKQTTRSGTARAKRGARQARKVPGVAQAEGQAKGAVASAGDLAIARYDKLTADEIVSKLGDLSQVDLAKVDSYERKSQNRTTILTKITSLRGDEPWAGYDELSAAEIESVLGEGDDDRAKDVRSYERSHKNRAGVLKAAERDLANA